MPFTTQTSDFWGWYLRHNNRVVWKHLSDAGIDVFASGPSNNSQSFLDLTNVLPSMSGGLLRRWGTQQVGIVSGATVTLPVRTFLYNAPQDLTNPTNTVNTNLWLTTDNQNFSVFKDSGVAYTGYAPTNFASAGSVNATVSREWFYYGNGVNPARKIQLNYTTKNTDTLLGIALPCNSPGSTQYSDYPAVLLSAAAVGTPGQVGLLTGGTNFMGGTTYVASGGSGTGMQILVTSTVPGTGAINGYVVLNWGSGYALGNVVSLSAGGTSATFKIVVLPVSSGTGSGGTGLGYTPVNSSFTVNISDAGGSGTGGVVTCYTDSNGAVFKAAVTTPGSGYKQAYATLPVPTGTGSYQGYVTCYTQVNSSAGGSGTVVGVDLAGPMRFVSGRQYAVALQNSLTGHTTDVAATAFATQVPFGPTNGGNYNTLTQGYADVLNATLSTLPVYASSPNQSAGFTQINLTISVPATGLDSQVDTVILLAAADGGSLGTLYQVQTFPLSSFTLANGFYTKQYYDTLPDSYDADQNVYNVANTLLGANLWAYTDQSGDTFGILLNTPPTATGFLYPTIHQGRMFATDGKTVFFSKSLDEVTTNTGLITSKWEECWPGDYQLPVALNNETILGLKSDGTNLHIGTDKSIFTLYGSDPSNFDIPSMAFAQTGILSNDCWSVIYAEGVPSGFVWITQDYKVIHSDFSTYREIGTPIYPILKTFDTSHLAQAKVLSLTQGPYNFVMLIFSRIGSSYPQPEIWLWESRLQKWYHWSWTPTENNSTTPIQSAFVYQYPSYSTAGTAGTKFLWYWLYNTSTHNVVNGYFNPTAQSDLGGTVGIPWSIQTSWQDCGDATAIKVLNEIEITSDETLPINVTVYGATSQTQFDIGGAILRTGTTQAGPLASLGTNKFYCAGSPTAAKYYSLAFSPTLTGSGPSVLTSFSMEYYPMARI